MLLWDVHLDIKIGGKKEGFDAAAVYHCSCKDRLSLQPTFLSASPLFEQKEKECKQEGSISYPVAAPPLSASPLPLQGALFLLLLALNP